MRLSDRDSGGGLLLSALDSAFRRKEVFVMLVVLGRKCGSNALVYGAE
jgi:hypothetical protein